MPDMKNMVSRMHLMNLFERLNLTPSACGLSLACLEWQACMHKIYVTTANYCHLIFYLVQACFCIKWTWVSPISSSLEVWLGPNVRCANTFPGHLCALTCAHQRVYTCLPSNRCGRDDLTVCLTCAYMHKYKGGKPSIQFSYTKQMQAIGVINIPNYASSEICFLLGKSALHCLHLKNKGSIRANRYTICTGL